jgi:hypothetical protein
MQVVRRLPIWLISVGCIAIGVANRLDYHDVGETRIEGWHYYEAAVADWYLAGMVLFWSQLFVWCFVGLPRGDFRWISFVGGVILSGVLILGMSLFCAPEYLFH